MNSNKIGLLDYAIFPFIRQFRNVDIDWFENLNLSFLNNWYLSIVESKAFFDIMKILIYLRFSRAREFSSHV